MSFEPFSFTYTPPATVTPPPPAQPFVSTTTTTNAGIFTNKASYLASRFSDLADTSEYLQSVILALSNFGVDIDINVHPEFGAAFASVYPGQDVPTTIPIWLYNHWLKADVGISQVQSAIGSDSGLDTNPKQAADLSTLTSTVENALLANVSYQTQLPILLRSLQQDAVVQQAIQTGLNSYPIVVGTGTASTLTDVGPEVQSYLSDIADRSAIAYASTYTLMTSPSVVDNDINDVALAFLAQAPDDILRLVGLFTAAEGLIHKQALEDIAKDIANYALSRVCAEAAGLLMIADRFAQSVTSPISMLGGSLGKYLNTARAYNNLVGLAVSGPLKGISSANACAMSAPAAKNNSMNMPKINQQINADIAKISKGMLAACQTINHIMDKQTEHAQDMLRHFRRSMERKLGLLNNNLAALCALKSLLTLVTLATQIVQTAKSGNPSTISKIGQALTGVTTGSSVSYGSSNGVINAAINVAIPKPSPTVSAVLIQGGANA